MKYACLIGDRVKELCFHPARKLYAFTMANSGTNRAVRYAYAEIPLEYTTLMHFITNLGNANYDRLDVDRKKFKIQHNDGYSNVDVNNTGFRIYIQWLYTSKIHTRMPPLERHLSRETIPSTEWFNLIEADIIRGRIFDQKFQNDILAAIRSWSDEASYTDRKDIILATIAKIYPSPDQYEYTPSRGLQKLVAEIAGNDREFVQVVVARGQFRTISTEFVADVLNVVAGMVDRPSFQIQHQDDDVTFGGGGFWSD